IFSGRNDNYSADFKTRVQAALQRNQAEAAARNLDVEWLVAEWNPTNEDYLGYHLAGVKSYVANPRLHTQVISPSVAEHVSFLQFFAKNIAIRRATGDWILVTNADCIFDDHIWDFLAQGQLCPDVMYRAERCDASATHFDQPFEVIR